MVTKYYVQSMDFIRSIMMSNAVSAISGKVLPEHEDYSRKTRNTRPK